MKFNENTGLGFWLKETSPKSGLWAEFPFITPEKELNGFGSILKVGGLSEEEIMEASSSCDSIVNCVQILFDGLVSPEAVVIRELGEALEKGGRDEILENYGNLEVDPVSIQSWIDVVQADARGENYGAGLGGEAAPRGVAPRYRALILSLGGTPEAAAASIRKHRPETVCFFASEETVERVPDVRKTLAPDNIPFRDAKVLCDDFEDLVHCYRRALTCAHRLAELVPDLKPEEVVVDYTGGTKTMSVALALATVNKDFHFSYVGGRKRTKEGTGTVVSGTEIVKAGLSPWQLFAVEKKRRIALYFNRYQFVAAQEALDQLPGTLPDRQGRLFECMKHIVNGYAQWDRFIHKGAAAALGRGAYDLRVYCDGAEDPGLRRFWDGVQANLAFLQSLAREKTAGTPLAVDLLSNARRRCEEGKYDDAVARLYRTLELIGQIAFREAFGCDTGKTPPDRVPERLRETYVNAYLDRDGQYLKLPAYAAFRMLQETGHAAGGAYFAEERAFDEVLRTRNDSILAHGTTPVKREAFERLEDLIRTRFDLREEVRFPKLEA